MTPFPLEIDIVSDVVCPWCIIGYKQLQRALESAPGEFEVKLRWQPFELNPRMPEEGQDLREHLAQKYGATAEQGNSTRSRLTALGEELGFRFDYADDMRMVNTFRAHQLLHWAGEQGKQTDLKLALFEAFFSRQADVNNLATLVSLAERVGLPGQTARELLQDARYAPAVREAQQTWLEREVHSVPMFFFNDRYFVPGAQGPETLVRVMRKVRDKSRA